MKDPATHWITESQLAVLVGARTQEVWSCFTGTDCLSVGEVQSELGFESKAVYYQVQKLVSAGLLVPCGGESGRAARFRRIAPQVRMPDGYQGQRYENLAAQATGAKLRKAMRQFQRAAELSAEQPELVDALYVGSGQLRLSPEKLKELKVRLRDLLLEFSAASSAEDAKAIRALWLLTPDL